MLWYLLSLKSLPRPHTPSSIISYFLLFVAKLPRISIVIYVGCLHLLSPAPLNPPYLSSQLSGMTVPSMTKFMGSSLTLLDLQGHLMWVIPSLLNTALTCLPWLEDLLVFLISPCLHLLSLIAAASTAAAKSLQPCPTPWDPIEGSPPGSPVPGILQARVLEWGAIAFSISLISQSLIFILLRAGHCRVSQA